MEGVTERRQCRVCAGGGEKGNDGGNSGDDEEVSEQRGGEGGGSEGGGVGGGEGGRVRGGGDSAEEMETTAPSEAFAIVRRHS